MERSYFVMDIQLHGGHHSGGSAQEVKQSAPGSVAAASIDNATQEERQELKNRLAGAKGRRYTDKTNSGAGWFIDSLKKALLGE